MSRPPHEIIVRLVVTTRLAQAGDHGKVPGFVPAGDGIVPDIALFLVL
jgi:hypothetical protein